MTCTPSSSPTTRFDVVHAHQVLQHVSDPVAALREMRRVCRPGGVVAARDSDYASFIWYPRNPVLDEWLALYRTVARINGGEPDAARHLLSWAQRAGFTDVTATASTWCFATPPTARGGAACGASASSHSGIANQAVQSGLATEDDLARMSTAWREWSEAAGRLVRRRARRDHLPAVGVPPAARNSAGHEHQLPDTAGVVVDSTSANLPPSYWYTRRTVMSGQHNGASALSPRPTITTRPPGSVVTVTSRGYSVSPSRRRPSRFGAAGSEAPSNTSTICGHGEVLDSQRLTTRVSIDSSPVSSALATVSMTVPRPEPP